jgi:hypothetical protein
MTRLRPSTLALLFVACAAPSAPSPTAPSVLVPPDCGQPIPGLDELARPGRLVMLGELHGTREIPDFTGDLACQAARHGIPVRLGLEVPRGDGPALARLLAAPDDDAARAAVLTREHWQRPDQDGRSSEAMLGLIERVGILRRLGLAIDIFAFDTDAHPQQWNARDAAMATAILAQTTTAPQSLVVTLSGNLHNRTVPGLPWDPAAVPMGVHVRRAVPGALSLDVRYLGGTAWICQERCGLTEVRGSREGEPRRVVLAAAHDEHGYNGVFAVGPISAASPAVASNAPR